MVGGPTDELRIIALHKDEKREQVPRLHLEHDAVETSMGLRSTAVHCTVLTDNIWMYLPNIELFCPYFMVEAKICFSWV